MTASATQIRPRAVFSRGPGFWIAVLAAFGTGIALGIAVASLVFHGESTTLVSLAPSDSASVSLIEVNRFIDRNFELRVERPLGRSRTIFRSPDEGLPIGSERIIWSQDATRFVLVGRHFFAAGAPRLLSGETLYLLCDLSTGAVWCNSPEATGFRHFGMAELHGTSWVGEMKLVESIPATAPNP